MPVDGAVPLPGEGEPSWVAETWALPQFHTCAHPADRFGHLEGQLWAAGELSQQKVGAPIP